MAAAHRSVSEQPLLHIGIAAGSWHVDEHGTFIVTWPADVPSDLLDALAGLPARSEVRLTTYDLVHDEVWPNEWSVIARLVAANGVSCSFTVPSLPPERTQPVTVTAPPAAPPAADPHAEWYAEPTTAYPINPGRAQVARPTTMRGPRPLLLIPSPADARLVAVLIEAAAGWYDREYHRPMPSTHIAMQNTEFGSATVVYDRAVH